MSAFIVNNETISAIVKGFEVYDVNYEAEGYIPPYSVIVSRQQVNNSIGQSLLEQNYKSVNYRYRENKETPKFEFTDVKVNEGLILGCIDCYSYQACETDDYFESNLYYSLVRLKDAMLRKLIQQKGQEIAYGYRGYSA